MCEPGTPSVTIHDVTIVKIGSSCRWPIATKSLEVMSMHHRRDEGSRYENEVNVDNVEPRLAPRFLQWANLGHVSLHVTLNVAGGEGTRSN